MRYILFSLAYSKRNIVFYILVLLAFCIVSGIEVSIRVSLAISTPTVISTIRVGSNPYGVGVNYSTNRIYVVNNSDNTVSVIDGDSNTVVSTISVGSYPYGVGVNSSTNRIYVANYYSSTVSVIDGGSNTVVSTISVGSYPYGAGVNTSTNRIYVTNTQSNTVSVIDGDNNTVVSTISVGSYPDGVGVNSSTNRIYVANYYSSTVSVIDGDSNTVVSTIQVGTYPREVGVNSTTNRIYVIDGESYKIRVIDGTTNEVISDFMLENPFEKRPYGIGVNSSLNHIYVTNNWSDTLSVIDGTTNTVISTTYLNVSYGVGVNSSTNLIYVAGSENGNDVIFVMNDSTATSKPPSVMTGSATNVTSDSATLNGTVNANGLSTTVWFEYDTTSRSFANTSATYGVGGSDDKTVSSTINGLISGTTYYYRIVAKNNSGTTYGSEKSFKTLENLPPTVTTGNATSVTTNSAMLDGTVNANGLSTTAWFQYGTASSSYVNTSSTQNVSGTNNTTISINISGLSSGTTYFYRTVAQNNSGTTYGSEKSFTTSDTSAPTGSISINGDATYTKSTSVTLTLSATDNAGITGYYISNSSTKPSASATGWTSVTSTTSYSANVSYTLSSGDGSKTVYVWYKDNSGNISNSASDSIILDTTAPTITITSPTSDDNYTVTSSVIAIGGTASDSTSGISSVTWSNDKGGSGTASGTTSWLTTSISLLSGENIITVTATDGAGNTGTDKITVIYNTGTVSTPTPTLTPASSPTPILTPTTEPSEKGIISGYVVDKRGNPIESAKIRLKGTSSKILRKTISDEEGLFEFTDLEADTYIITAIKNGYKRAMQTITLEEGEEKEIEMEMKKKRIRGK